METSLFNRVQATLLALATAALFALAALNLNEEHKFQQPDDGVWWHEAAGGLRAERVLGGGMPGQVAHAGLCSAVLPLKDIAPRLNRLFAGERG